MKEEESLRALVFKELPSVKSGKGAGESLGGRKTACTMMSEKIHASTYQPKKNDVIYLKNHAQ